MRKHLFGLGLFSLILGTAIIVEGLTQTKTEVIDTQPVTPITYEAATRSCWRSGRQNIDGGQASVKVTQAVLNEKTQKLNLSFNVQRETPSTQNVRIKLTFANGTSNGGGGWEGVIKSDYVDFTPNFNVENKATFSTSYKFSEDFDANENLYVAAELADGSPTNSKFTKKINAGDFTPVLLTDKNF